MQTGAQIEEKLKDAFKQLVMTEPVEKITISQITDRAGVIRTTFYHHFQDKYQLMEQIVLEDIVMPIGPLLENEMIDEAVRLVFFNFCRNKELYMRLARTTGQNSFEQIIQKCIQDIFFQIIGGKLQAGIDAKSLKREWLSPDIVSRYYARTISFAVMYWIEMGMPYTPKEISEIYEYFISHSLQDVVDELRMESL